ncbi:type II toxin-antitoxin system antitoxin, RelB/DinJ family [Methylobacterium currus]|uniref:Type II toxin-antitoxin system antitoxin, RelB/DinJ family n=1 Tax=Methylobacterium currus TaxID=2051553 RepID=A0A2R4WHW9_9HYPH|nr:type II toxin-antitoxin system RelB/DinJ family antitoxin [Methylobacterium currus]AWB21130.1 type II toxin-antitoxin system antitoxin, RelB/DinJ family [Methylobacterium currus]UHC14029.1 type II toxin-antitoxin system RelB/DinJ family antitoxin [Methylobacterium currus]
MAAEMQGMVRIDAAMERDAAAVLADIGLTVSEAGRLMLIRTAREHALPFDPFVPNETTMAATREVCDGRLSPFDSVEASMADLQSQA